MSTPGADTAAKLDCLTTSRLFELPATLEVMECEAVSEGFRMITRLRTQWESGVNRFDCDGEILLGTFHGGRLVGIGGLNRDPYMSDPRVGRVRHLYVMKDLRRAGVGKGLVERILQHAAGTFDTLRLWTDRAGVFYERLGFGFVEGRK